MENKLGKHKVHLWGRVLEDARTKSLKAVPLPKEITDIYDVIIEKGDIRFEEKNKQDAVDTSISLDNENKYYAVCECAPNSDGGGDIRIIEYYDSMSFATELMNTLYNINFENHAYIILPFYKTTINQYLRNSWISIATEIRD